MTPDEVATVVCWLAAMALGVRFFTQELAERYAVLHSRRSMETHSPCEGDGCTLVVCRCVDDRGRVDVCWGTAAPACPHGRSLCEGHRFEDDDCLRELGESLQDDIDRETRGLAS